MEQKVTGKIELFLQIDDELIESWIYYKVQGCIPISLLLFYRLGGDGEGTQQKH